MEFFTSILWLCAFIGIVATLYYIYERSSLMSSRQYYCPPNLLRDQLIADGLLLGKYITILLILFEIGGMAFYLKGVINVPTTLIFVVNLIVMLYVILTAIYLGPDTHLLDVYETLKKKWEEGKTYGEFYNDEVNLFRTIRDCRNFNILFFCIAVQFILILPVMF